MCVVLVLEMFVLVVGFVCGYYGFVGGVVVFFGFVGVYGDDVVLW